MGPWRLPLFLRRSLYIVLGDDSDSRQNTKAVVPPTSATDWETRSLVQIGLWTKVVLLGRVLSRNLRGTGLRCRNHKLPMARILKLFFEAYTRTRPSAAASFKNNPVTNLCCHDATALERCEQLCLRQDNSSGSFQPRAVSEAIQSLSCQLHMLRRTSAQFSHRFSTSFLAWHALAGTGFSLLS